MSGGAVLLAAGASRRFGSDKRRHQLPDGTSLLSASTRLYGAAFDQLIVVLRPEDADLAAAIAAAWPQAQVVYCGDAHRGMGHSLSAGIDAAQGWRYAFVALADMAWVRPTTLARLRAVLEAAPADAIVQPMYLGAPGHPVGFGAARFAGLSHLSGDQGARHLIREAGERLIRVAVDDPGILEDLDTPPPAGGDRSPDQRAGSR